MGVEDNVDRRRDGWIDEEVPPPVNPMAASLGRSRGRLARHLFEERKKEGRMDVLVSSCWE